ncbi:hypothetical protein EJ03DRAFT_9746 [Teratosphaeria nubilosa]|uniref:Uncharacterized protein n=1 Tax=Teratosphaeria nubilosa TaxID=161662 RepID=A0A6G1LFU8_9PEZI|nr:hypothetical protein EJ03DRAFT_9746 [Teratosphaeria nubilosa]
MSLLVGGALLPGSTRLVFRSDLSACISATLAPIATGLNGHGRIRKAARCQRSTRGAVRQPSRWQKGTQSNSTLEGHPLLLQTRTDLCQSLNPSRRSTPLAQASRRASWRCRTALLRSRINKGRKSSIHEEAKGVVGSRGPTPQRTASATLKPKAF